MNDFELIIYWTRPNPAPRIKIRVPENKIIEHTQSALRYVQAGIASHFSCNLWSD